ncbi:ogr/Delta-like zinc finger family protein [Thalassospira sp.]|uniref:ogr/Delta-like zinc finger family protein n=1 Tax=Thalassospira sp. TaxID=1912094 RepID=UPI001B22FCD8|nr:ogr/Delta-like zinc finger family protein [Thalassospira sp.]MBO6841382.1 ogr/Delta-like zinc finger family protein [Thalassospira sp.]
MSRPYQNATHCPHCKSRCRTVKTRRITATYREVTFCCSNDDCGCIFVAEVNAVRVLSPSLIPDPSINLPAGRVAL